jgi:alpha-D-ribose 1-methylphosphonate 5-triphosphate synthase subunit PhnH
MDGLPIPKHLEYGFDDPASDSQQTFRAIVAAMDCPGRLATVHEKPYAPDVFHSASAAACLTFLEYETPVWTDIEFRSSAISWLQIACGSSVVTEPSMAHFALITNPETMPALDDFRIGSNQSLEYATTIIVQVDDILPTAGKHHFNIFIDNAIQLELKGIPDKFWYQWRQLSILDPLGIDIFFTCDDVLMALPKKNERCRKLHLVPHEVI